MKHKNYYNQQVQTLYKATFWIVLNQCVLELKFLTILIVNSNFKLKNELLR